MAEASQVCIVGGGPAGLVLGLLFARRGIECVVLEKHRDFLRDFRGDTIHASTVELMRELGLAERFLALPHQEVDHLNAFVGGQPFRIADFSVLGRGRGRIVFMPQWDFLEFVASEARRYSSFELRMESEVVGVERAAGRIAGVRVRQGGEERVLRAALTIACDGRDSAVRRSAGLVPRDFGAPMDVLWFRIPRSAGDPDETAGFVGAGAMLVLICRGAYWQAGFIIPKGGFEQVRHEGLGALRTRVAALVPFLDEARLATVASWDDVRELRVQVNRLRRWHLPGLLLIGDAAHAMSPIGGVGINLAIQDAVAAANLLSDPLRSGTLRERVLARVQRRREWPTIATQAAQLIAQRFVIRRALEARGRPLRAPRWLPKALGFAPVRAAVARGVAIGLRPEHVGAV